MFFNFTQFVILENLSALDLAPSGVKLLSPSHFLWKKLNTMIITFELTVPSLSKLANSSLRVIINSSAVHLDESSVNPTISANRMLKGENIFHQTSKFYVLEKS